jgi:hypothetical protein
VRAACLAAFAFAVMAAAGCSGESTSGGGTDVQPTPDAQVDTTPDVTPDVALDVTPDVALDTPAELPPLTYAPCPDAVHIGGFTLVLDDEYTGLSGAVADGVVPSNIAHLVAEEGPCRLLEKENLFCDPPCVPGETCGTEGACIPYPDNRDVGLVTVTGLVEPLEIEAKWGDNYNNPGTMAHPGFETGATIQLTAAGAELAGFQLQGYGVESLQVSGKSVSIGSEGASEVSWTAPAAASPAMIHLALNINNHGSTSAWIECDAEDSGSLTLPATLITELYAMGLSGFPSLNVTRQSVDSADLEPGCVQLAVTSIRALAVEVDGVTSCTQDNQCPPNQTCGVDLQCH